jgi:tripartite-type tricarboxylate transporter receptor subunit TctC
MRSLAAALFMLVVVGAAAVGADEPFPTRPITIVNPFPPGGQADLTGRPLAAALERVLK